MGLVAVHLRRGDYKRHYPRLATWSIGLTSSRSCRISFIRLCMLLSLFPLLPAVSLLIPPPRRPKKEVQEQKQKQKISATQARMAAGAPASPLPTNPTTSNTASPQS